jgi:hypothetical protein
MAGILYRCVFCETTHEVARRSDGPVYLRCPTTYQWAWYDARAFDLASPARRAGRTAAPRRSGGVRRAKSAAPARAKAGSARRAGRRAPTRASSRKRPRKAGRR